MSEYYWQCKKCGTKIEQRTSPNIAGCPESSSHQWVRLAEVGTKINYHCNNCGITIKTNGNSPTYAGCPSNNGGAHKWIRL